MDAVVTVMRGDTKMSRTTGLNLSADRTEAQEQLRNILQASVEFGGAVYRTDDEVVVELPGLTGTFIIVTSYQGELSLIGYSDSWVPTTGVCGTQDDESID